MVFLAAAVITGAAASAPAAAVECALTIDANVRGAEAIATAAKAAKFDASAVRLTDVSVADPLSFSPALVALAAQPPPADAGLAAFVVADAAGGRSRLIVCDRRTRRRVAQESIDDRWDASSRIPNIFARAAAKSQERSTVRVIALPSRTLLGGRPTPAPDIDAAVAATLIGRPDVFLVETEVRRRLWPAPTLDAEPPSTEEAAYLLAADLVVPSLGNGQNRATLQITITPTAGGKPRVVNAVAARPDAVPEAAAAALRALALPRIALPSTRPAAADIAAAGRALAERSRFDDAAAVLDVAADLAPADVTIRQDVSRCLLRANGFLPPPPPGRPRVNVVDATYPPDAPTDATFDRIAARTFAALAHHRAAMDDLGPSPGWPPSDDVLRGVFEPPADPRYPRPLTTIDAPPPRLATHIATWRAIWLAWADERLRAGKDDDSRCLWTATSRLKQDERVDAMVDFVTAHRDVPRVFDRVSAYAENLGTRDPKRGPSRQRYYDRVAAISPEFASTISRIRDTDRAALARPPGTAGPK